jgi:putative endopeptidase
MRLDQGSRFNADGRFENWWSEADRAHFEDCARTLAAYIETFPLRDGERVDARLTLGENIADFGGLAIAYDALQETFADAADRDPMRDGYSRSQRFFLNWALIWRQNLTDDERRLRLRTDTHAPSTMRANAASANLGVFAEAFGCESGNAMWRAPHDRIGVW